MRAQHVQAPVELVIAQRKGVDPGQIHQLDDGLSAVAVRNIGALERIAGVEQDRGSARSGSAPLDRAQQVGRPAALSALLGLGIQRAVKVVEMEDRDLFCPSRQLARGGALAPTQESGARGQEQAFQELAAVDLLGHRVSVCACLWADGRPLYSQCKTASRKRQHSLHIAGIVALRPMSDQVERSLATANGATSGLGIGHVLF